MGRTKRGAQTSKEKSQPSQKKAALDPYEEVRKRERERLNALRRAHLKVNEEKLSAVFKDPLQYVYVLSLNNDDEAAMDGALHSWIPISELGEEGMKQLAALGKFDSINSETLHLIEPLKWWLTEKSIQRYIDAKLREDEPDSDSDEETERDTADDADKIMKETRFKDWTYSSYDIKGLDKPGASRIFNIYNDWDWFFHKREDEIRKVAKAKGNSGKLRK